MINDLSMYFYKLCKQNKRKQIVLNRLIQQWCIIYVLTDYCTSISYDTISNNIRIGYYLNITFQEW